MAKRFKLRICRVIATTLQSCRSKDPSNLPQDPVPSLPPLSQFSSATAHPPQFKWQHEDKWHVVAKIHHHPPPRPRLKIYAASSSSDNDDLTFAQPKTPPPPPPPPPSSSAERNRRRAKKKKNVPSRLRLSTSSADSGWFSSEGGCAAAADEEETETLVSSSISLSPGDSSSDFKLTNSRRNRSRRVPKRTKRGGSRPPSVAAAEEIPARLSMFRKLIPCTVEGKVKESFAIVKRSEDPYEDFRSSMMDMIVEKQMFEEKDLEQLLQCFLSLNSRHYHGVIVQAFSEIWEAIFATPPPGSKPSAPHHRRRVSGLASV